MKKLNEIKIKGEKNCGHREKCDFIACNFDVSPFSTVNKMRDFNFK